LEANTGERVDVNSGQQAYFALLAKEMLSLADKYKKDVHVVHKIFYGLSCNYENLIKFLDNPSSKDNIKPWEPLEDLALKGTKDAAAYKYVIDKRNGNDIAERKRFLEI
jgi:hypothetical protein